MNDLKKAILDVLDDATQITGNGTLHLQGYYSVDKTLLKTLQEEYNIHFVEPEDEQVRCI